MSIYMKLKDSRTFLLSGAFFLFLLLFAMMSSVAAADTANDTQVVYDNSLEDKHIPNFDNMTNNDVMNSNRDNMVFSNNTRLELSNIKTDSITIQNNDKKTILRNITCDVLTIENSRPDYVDILDSNIKKVNIRNISSWSLWEYKWDIKNSTIDSLIIEDSRIPYDLRITSSDIGNITLNNSSINWVLFYDHSNAIIKTCVGSTINLIRVYDHSNAIIKKRVGSTINLIYVS